MGTDDVITAAKVTIWVLRQNTAGEEENNTFRDIALKFLL